MGDECVTTCAFDKLFALEDGDDLVLCVFDHLDLPHVFTLGASCRKMNELCNQWFPWRAVHTIVPPQPKAETLARKYMALASLAVTQFEHSNPFVLGRAWTVDVAPKGLAAAALMRRLGEYESAEEVLLMCVGASREELPGDAVIEELGTKLLEGALSESLQHLDEILDKNEDKSSVEAINLVLSELVRVSEEKRLSFHYFNKMLPYAARAVEYGKRAIRSLSQGGGSPLLEGEMRRLVLVNQCWLTLSLASDRQQRGGGLGADDGLLKVIKDVRGELCELRARTNSSDREGLALVEQAEGTSRYCEAAYLLQGPEALERYDLAQACFERALDLLEGATGKRSIQYAACCVELGICMGNRRRTVDFTSRAKLMAAKWYYTGLSIRKERLGNAHPLTARASFGYASHSQPLATVLM
uniref:F-box domain-containing protein n=1 Tax=Hemiselmis andersenii TaxID=464988 RepID=A0A6U4KT08_HEMAN